MTARNVPPHHGSWTAFRLYRRHPTRIPANRKARTPSGACRRSQYPPLPEPDKELPARALPEVVTSCRDSSQNASRPCPRGPLQQITRTESCRLTEKGTSMISTGEVVVAQHPVLGAARFDVLPIRDGRVPGIQPSLLESIVSRSPLKPSMPLVAPPPPDHCHISAYALELVWPPKNCAHGPDPWLRHQPYG